LLKYLVAAPEHRRSCEQIIELLWPEVDPDRGRDYLRDTVSRLRRSLEPDRRAYDLSPYVMKDRESVCLVVREPTAHAPGAWLDTQAFEMLGYAALAAFERGEDLRPLAYSALELHRGPFMALDLYNDWAKSARLACQRLWSTLMRRVALMEWRDQQVDRAILLLGQLLDVVPDDEDATQLAMIANAHVGHRGEALRLFRALSDYVREEHGSEPPAELKALSDAIRSGNSVHSMQQVLPHLG
jgi:DNA-binding SARP family transcriptional activator